MNERIKKLMDVKNLTLSTFADMTGINSTTLSFIINGRPDKTGNGKSVQKPSTDVILQILNTFPDINSDWLLLGKEPMSKGKNPMILPVSAGEQADLFSPTAIDQTKPASENKYRKENIVHDPPNTTEPIKKQQVVPNFSMSENVSEIIIFFKDNTHLILKP
jgi:transcriptional regulator with XRE-family HTH domain